MQVYTNNPLVLEKLGDTMQVKLFECTFCELLVHVRDEVHRGARLLTHPLSGSVKPNETPYKSILIEEGKTLDLQSLKLIENAISTAEHFPVRYPAMTQQIRADFQLIDYTLLQSALS